MLGASSIRVIDADAPKMVGIANQVGGGEILARTEVLRPPTHCAIAEARIPPPQLTPAIARSALDVVPVGAYSGQRRQFGPGVGGGGGGVSQFRWSTYVGVNHLFLNYGGADSSV